MLNFQHQSLEKYEVNKNVRETCICMKGRCSEMKKSKVQNFNSIVETSDLYILNYAMQIYLKNKFKIIEYIALT